MLDDGELVARIREGDLDAFETLYRRYKDELYRTALAISRDRGAAEELLQDCFLRAYDHMDRVDGYASLRPWLHRIIVNLSYNWAAKRRLRLISIEDVFDRLLMVPRTSPERAFEREELLQVVDEALRSLSMRQRVVVVLFYLQGFSLAEIAYVLDCPVGTVKSRLHNARRVLRQELMADARISREAAFELLSS
ncbi:MAG: sigma-70 family RNA polymerase sigma factor [Anaerolineae bacterium]|nr:sigma-70 family RNA polymerase sigma factor [Anaerolineae bacterium]NIN99434.1 sigma-70 family RNA polymerase sigma factor [Anaerolineae bacterium]NIQ82299.1 sigma-70 family RNA polymerase sigma factor [Anaerolineae bacterium]